MEQSVSGHPMHSPAPSWDVVGPGSVAPDVEAGASCERMTAKWEFPKIRGTLIWGPDNKDPTI